MSAIIAADRAFLALLGICNRTILANYAQKRRVSRLNKPYPAHPASFGEVLRKHRLDSGLTQAELAKKLGVSPSSVDKWECDWTTPPNRYREVIEAFLDFNPFSKSHDLTVAKRLPQQA